MLDEFIRYRGLGGREGGQDVNLGGGAYEGCIGGGLPGKSAAQSVSSAACLLCLVSSGVRLLAIGGEAEPSGARRFACMGGCATAGTLTADWLAQMNCNRIAPFYEWFEKAAFGARLQNHRINFLHIALNKQRALVLGDGDGRFVQALAHEHPELQIDCVEMSSGMVAQARKRLAPGAKIQMIQCDAFEFDFARERYDVVFTHFFLDCFEDAALQTLLRLVSNGMKGHAAWILSDFRQAQSGWQKLYTGAWLTSMYLFFRLVTGLKTRRLPEYASALQKAGFSKHEEFVSMAGLIASEWWQHY